MPPKISLLKLTQVEAVKKIYENNHVIQDMLVPISCMKESVLKFHEHLEVRFFQKRTKKWYKITHFRK